MLLLYKNYVEKRKMDNNFNMQQNNMQQPVYQQMPQGQPMYQQMPTGQPKKKGLIIGAIVAFVVIIIFFAIVGPYYLKQNKLQKLYGTWSTSIEGKTVKMSLDSDKEGTMIGTGTYKGNEVPMIIDLKWELDGDVLILVEEEGDVSEYEIIELTDSKLVIEDDDGEKYTFRKSR